MNMSAEIIPIYAAISPDGEIFKSSISPFRIHAQRYAVQRKNFQVVKLADINAEIKGAKPKIAPVSVAPQTVDSVVEIPTMKQKRKYTRRSKESVA